MSGQSATNSGVGAMSAPSNGSSVFSNQSQHANDAQVSDPSLPRPSSHIVISSIRTWFHDAAWPGMGLFGESYLLFSVGTLKPIWGLLYPDCFAGSSYADGIDGSPVCSDRLLRCITYSIVIGVIVGMIALGTLANRIGRRAGSIATASLMAFGAIGLSLVTVLLNSVPSKLFMVMSTLLFCFGVGVGGEYPLSAATANERAMEEIRARSTKGVEEQGIEMTGVNRSAEKNGRSKDLIFGRSRMSEDGKRQIPEPVETQEPSEQEHQGLVFKRGRRVLLTFTMQGVGIFFNALVLSLLILITNQMGSKSKAGEDDDDYFGMDDDYVNDAGGGYLSGSYDPIALLAIWQSTYAIGAVILIYVLLSRIVYLKESDVWSSDKAMREDENTENFTILRKPELFESPISSIGANRRREESRDERNVAGSFGAIGIASSLSPLTDVGISFDYNGETLREVPSTTSEGDRNSTANYLLIKNYGYRLVGTSASWLLWDVAFYGNKLFQSSFLVALFGEGVTLFELTTAAAINALIALFGYFAAAIIIDHPSVGRFNLQIWGFFLTGTLFVCCGFMKDNISRGWLVMLYFFSSFFGQCGPNATTFLIPAEIFPTECRTMCHGISAAWGKVGALLAAVVFNHVDDVQLFLVSGYCSFAACVITFLTIPETTSLDLYEVDRKWRMILAGRKGDYVGLANSPQYLSYMERRKIGYNY